MDKDIKIIITNILQAGETNIYKNMSKSAVWFNLLEAV